MLKEASPSCENWCIFFLRVSATHQRLCFAFCFRCQKVHIRSFGSHLPMGGNPKMYICDPAFPLIEIYYSTARSYFCLYFTTDSLQLRKVWLTLFQLYQVKKPQAVSRKQWAAPSAGPAAAAPRSPGWTLALHSDLRFQVPLPNHQLTFTNSKHR